MNRKNLGLFLIVFAMVLLVNSFFASKQQDEKVAPAFQFTSIKSKYHPGDKVVLSIINNSGQQVSFEEECPLEPFDVYRKEGAEWQLLTAEAQENGLYSCSGEEKVKIANGESLQINYAPWNEELFSIESLYKVEAVLQIEDAVSEEANIGPATPDTRTLVVEFAVAERGIFRSFGLAVFYRPLLNFLVFLTKVIPGHNFGWAIILLTIAVRLVLFIPTYRSLEQQKSMQEIQPKLKALKEKYKGDQQKLGEETMKLYKEHGVNPFGSCLPILIQMPFLFAIFQILRQGLDNSTSFLLYTPLRDFPLDSINVAFFGFDLSSVPDNFYLRLIPPILVGGSQFLTMKLTQSMQKKKIKDITPSENKEPDQMKEMEKATGMMMYMMPLMIAFFAYSYPVGLSLYWFCSTVFSIGQQVVLNKRKQQLSSLTK